MKEERPMTWRKGLVRWERGVGEEGRRGIDHTWTAAEREAGWGEGRRWRGCLSVII